jgi:hypothetical protein
MESMKTPDWPDFTVDHLAWEQAKELLGETANISLLAQLAQQLKDGMNASKTKKATP